MHLALGLERFEQGGAKRIPTKSRVMIPASQLRSEEYQQEQQFSDCCQSHRTKLEAEMYAITHDIFSPHRGRNFQDVHLFLSRTNSWPDGQSVRIFDLQCASEEAHVTVGQFGPTSNGDGLGGSANLAVWKGHMRFLYPSADTEPTAWRDWESQIHEAITKERRSWIDELPNDTDVKQPIDLYPCKLCTKRCRPAIQDLGIASGTKKDGSQATEVNQWWLRENPWAGLTNNRECMESDWPTCNLEWRDEADPTDRVRQLFGGICSEFDMSKMRDLTVRGDEIIAECGSLYGAMCQVQEFQIREMATQAEFVTKYAHLFPTSATDMISVLTNGVVGYYQWSVPVPPTPRGLPYKITDAEQTSTILPELREDIARRRLFLCTTRMVGLDERLESTPTTTVERKTRIDRSVRIDALSPI